MVGGFEQEVVRRKVQYGAVQSRPPFAGMARETSVRPGKRPMSAQLSLLSAILDSTTTPVCRANEERGPSEPLVNAGSCQEEEKHIAVMEQLRADARVVYTHGRMDARGSPMRELTCTRTQARCRRAGLVETA